MHNMCISGKNGVIIRKRRQYAFVLEKRHSTAVGTLINRLEWNAKAKRQSTPTELIYMFNV
jgi:hypothetical protein